MAVQNIGGASSNLQMGLLLEIKPVSFEIGFFHIFLSKTYHFIR